MTKQEQIEAIINLTCDENAIALSEVEVGIIALDLLKSGLIAFGHKIPIADIAQGDTFKWGEKEYIKLDTLNEGCLCLAKDLLFKSKFDDETNDWSKSQLRGDLATKVFDFIPDIDKLMLFDRDLTTDDGLTYYGHCSDNISMLTCNEYRKYRKYIPTTSECYWTITAHTFGSYYVRFVIPDGALNYSDTHSSYRMVRPLICLDKDTLVEVE